MLTIFITILATTFFLIVALNFIPSEKKINRQIKHLYGVNDKLFKNSLGHLLGPHLIPGNSIIPLLNGDEIFPEMLTAIKNAKRSICFETYIFDAGIIGQKFIDALSERSLCGVSVNLIVDYVGAMKMDRKGLKTLEKAGVKVVQFRPISWYTLTKFNNRTHRKLLIVDGTVGFTGGVGIADHWLGNAQSPDNWRDTHVKIEGPVVADLQAAFMDNWLRTKSEVLHGEDYFPVLKPAGDCLSQVFKSSASEGSESARLMFLLSITSAKTSIKIGAAYFVPDDLAITTLCAAATRGVKVEIIVPSHISDQKVVRLVSRGLWKRLLKKGIRIYEYQPTMYHAKMIIIDGYMTSLGSTNLDSRSFRLNDEVNLNTLNYDIAETLTKHFENDKKQSIEITLASWKKRPILEKIASGILSILRTQL